MLTKPSQLEGDVVSPFGGDMFCLYRQRFVKSISLYRQR